MKKFLASLLLGLGLAIGGGAALAQTTPAPDAAPAAAAPAAPAAAGLCVAEYATTSIKKAVVGNGHAAKEQVQAMVKVLLPGVQALLPLSRRRAVLRLFALAGLALALAAADGRDLPVRAAGALLLSAHLALAWVQFGLSRAVREFAVAHPPR